jgi:hypothetical protein
MFSLYCDCFIYLNFKILFLRNTQHRFVLILSNHHDNYSQTYRHFNSLDYTQFDLFLNLLLQVHFFIYHIYFAFLAY